MDKDDDLSHKQGVDTMGLSASQSRYLMITARMNEVTLTGQQINQSRLQLSNQTNELFSTATTLDPDSNQAIHIQLEINKIANLDRSLEMQLRRVDTLQQALQTELEAVKKVIDKSIEQIYKTE